MRLGPNLSKHNVITRLAVIALGIRRPSVPFDMLVRKVRPSPITTTVIIQDTLMRSTVRGFGVGHSIAFKVRCRDISIGITMSGSCDVPLSMLC